MKRVTLSHRSLVSGTFTLAVAPEDVDSLLDMPVYSGPGEHISIRMALAARGAVVDELLLDGAGNAVAIASLPDGKPLISMGDSVFSGLPALRNLARMAVSS